MVTVHCPFSHPSPASKLVSGGAVTAAAGLAGEPPLCNRARQTLSGEQTPRRKMLVVVRKTYVTRRAEINDIVEAYGQLCVCGSGKGSDGVRIWGTTEDRWKCQRTLKADRCRL